MNLGLEGKRAIVTGGSRGIGRCCALALAREKVKICITARTQELLEKVKNEIDQAGGKGYLVVSDLTTLEGCQKVVEKTTEEFSSVDILINCAGAAEGEDILTLSAQKIDQALLLKSFGYLRMAQLVIPLMKKNKWGRIINIAGGAGSSPDRSNMPLSISNISVLNMTRALSDAVSQDGILVNTICPGLTNTQRARDLQKERAIKEDRSIEDILKELGSKLPAGRLAEPEEVANVVTFLASDACAYMFGSSLYMDGGGRRATP